MLEHDTLEVLVLTCHWAGKCGIALGYTHLASRMPLNYFFAALKTWGLRVASPWLTCRCGRLRTLVLVLGDAGMRFRWPKPGGHSTAELIAALPALAAGAPGLRALQLVLPMEAAEDGLGPLWRALEALPNLASLALGYAFALGDRRHAADMGERIADVLDAAQVRAVRL